MLARSIGIGWAHYANEECWLSELIGSFEGKGCESSGHYTEKELKSPYVQVAVMDPGSVFFGLELSLAAGQQLSSSFKT